MQTNAVLLARLDILNTREKLRDTDRRLAEIIRERLALRLELRAAEIRYQDELEAPRLREQGRDAVKAAVRVVEGGPG